MVSNNSKSLSADIFEISDFIHEIKKEYVNIPDETLYLGIFGYMSEVFSSLFQNSIVMAAEYSNESIPTKAKFEKNIIANALSLGISEINAKPATMEVMILFKKEDIEKNLYNDTFVLSREYPIYIGDYEFHLDYNIVLKRNSLATSDTDIYTATYDLTDVNGGADSYWNTVSKINSPYLKTPAIFTAGDIPTIGVYCTISQVSLLEVETKILTNNVIENKTMTFTFEDQLCDFRVLSTTAGETTILTPIYEGTYDSKLEHYCYYQFIDSNTIRIKFDSNVKGYPVLNTVLTVQAQTTKGEEGNFDYSETVVMSYNAESDMDHEEFPHKEYANIYMDLKPSTSSGGQNRKDMNELRKNIAKEAVSRGSITSTTDLENYFNAIDTEYSNTFFFKKEDNVLTRLYSSFIVMKDSNDNIIPTNTIDIGIDTVSSHFISDNDTPEATADDILYIPAMTKIYYTNMHLTQLDYMILSHTENWLPSDKNRIIDELANYNIFTKSYSEFFKDGFELDIGIFTGSGASYHYFMNLRSANNQSSGFVFSGIVNNAEADLDSLRIDDEQYFITLNLKKEKNDNHVLLTVKKGTVSCDTEGFDDSNPVVGRLQITESNYSNIVSIIVNTINEKTHRANNNNPISILIDIKDISTVLVNGEYYGTLDEPSEEILDSGGIIFEYAVPFTIMSKLSTQVCSCFLNNFDISRIVEFEGTNSQNETQFIASNLIWKRDTTTDDDDISKTYVLTMDVMENDSSDTLEIGEKRSVYIYDEAELGPIKVTGARLPVGTNISSETIDTRGLAKYIVEDIYLNNQISDKVAEVAAKIDEINGASDEEYDPLNNIINNYSKEEDNITHQKIKIENVIHNQMQRYGELSDISAIQNAITGIQDIILENSRCKVKAMLVFNTKTGSAYAIADEVLIKSNSQEGGYVYTVIFHIKTTGNIDANNNIEMILNWVNKESGQADEPHYITDPDESYVPVYVGYDAESKLYFTTYKAPIRNDERQVISIHSAFSNPEQSSQEIMELNRETLGDRDKLWYMIHGESTLSHQAGSRYFALSNIYKITDGTPFMFNYSDIVNCSIILDETASEVKIKSLPVVGYSYIEDTLNMRSFINELEKRRTYIAYALEVLEDSTAIDFKFVNTYGPSKIFVICDQPTAKSSSDYLFLDNVQISLYFAAKLSSSSDAYILDYIKSFIKEEIEKLDELSEVHIPNIAASVKQKYSEQIVYFEYLGTGRDGNEYINRTKQHISKYKDDSITKNPDYVPEFINIALAEDNYSPDIVINIV